jgi:nitroreductase
MEIIDLIHKRRSVREFVDTEISDADLHTILSAGMTAPSAMNKQEWEFIIVRDAKKKQAVTEFSEYAGMTTQSPISILVCADSNKEYGDNGEVDCSASVQNMLLTACALGIGSVWTGIKGNPKRAEGFTKLFELPAHIRPIAYVVFGYPKNKNAFVAKDYFDAKKLHNDKW